MSREKDPTINLIVPYVTNLIQEEESMDPTTDLGKAFSRCLLAQTKKRLLHYEENTIACFAMVLDPRFKEKAFHQHANYMNTITALTNILKERVKNLVQEENVTGTEEVMSVDSVAPGILKNLFTAKKINPKGKVSTSASSVKMNSSAALVVKLNLYLSDMKQYPFSMDILEYWQLHEFVELKQLALELFIIPSSLVTSERGCSAAEYTINKRRAHLLLDRVKKILYLNRNLQFVKDE